MFRETRCMIRVCPYGKKEDDRCRYSDLETEIPDREVRLRDKCRKDNHRLVWIGIRTQAENG